MSVPLHFTLQLTYQPAILSRTCAREVTQHSAPYCCQFKEISPTVGKERHNWDIKVPYLYNKADLLIFLYSYSKVQVFVQLA